MIYNPLSNKLYSDNKKFLKRLFCPYKLQWDDLDALTDSQDKFCSFCEKDIIDTKRFSDAALENLIIEDPEICFKIDFNQENIRIVNHV